MTPATSHQPPATSGERPIARLLGDIILVRADARETAPNGLIVPAQAQVDDEALRHQIPRYGTVLLCGPGRKTAKRGRIEMQTQPGDRIVFPDWVGAPIPGDPELAASEAPRLAMHDSEVWGVIE
jgi:co-chaperonin GroES (HSP10)